MSDLYLDILSFNLTYYRKQRHFSQKKLSTDTVIHRTYIAELEQGQRNPSIMKVYQLSIALKIKPYYLLKKLTPDETSQNTVAFVHQQQSKEMYMNDLIKTIKCLRTHFNYSQKNLAELAGLSESFIRAIEQGKQEPTLASLVKVSEAFELPLWKLVKGVDWNSVWLCHNMWL